jgi:hypothetical protein
MACAHHDQTLTGLQSRSIEIMLDGKTARWSHVQRMLDMR